MKNLTTLALFCYWSWALASRSDSTLPQERGTQACKSRSSIPQLDIWASLDDPLSNDRVCGMAGLAAKGWRSIEASLGHATLPKFPVVTCVLCRTNAWLGALGDRVSHACHSGICQNCLAARSPLGHIVSALRCMGRFRIYP